MTRINPHIAWQFFTRFGASLFNLFTGIILSRYLGSEGKGEHGLFIASLALIHLCTNWLGGSALVYLAPRYSVRQLAHISFKWSSLTALTCWLILLALGIMPEGYEYSLLFTSLVFAWWNNLANLLLGKQSNQAYNTLQVVHPVLSLLFMVLAFWAGEVHFLSFVVAYFLAQLLTLGMAVHYLRPDYMGAEREKDPKLIKVFVRHGLFIQLANLTQFFNYRLLFFLIDHYFGRGVLGLYSNALSLAESVWMVTRSISTVQLSKIVNSGNTLFNRALTRRYAFLSTGVSLIGVIVLVVLPDDFYVWVFGSEFRGMQHLLLLLSPAVLSMSLGNIYAHYFAGLGRNQVNFWGSFLNLVFITLGFFLLKSALGLDAAPVASSIAFTVAMVYHLLVFRFSYRK